MPDISSGFNKLRSVIKVSIIKVDANPSIGDRVNTCGETDGWTYMPKLKGAFRDLGEPAPKRDH